MYYSKIRSLILLGWAMTILFVVAAYGYALLSPAVKPDAIFLVTNLGAVIGLLAPHLTLVYEFFLSEQPRKNRKLDSTAAYAILAMCALYWIVFVGVVWLGVVFRVFSAVPDGNGLEKSTAIVVAIAGTLSFLAIKPTTKLFLLASEKQS
jgi:heme/copper-type cytochrome/quinol oxidase subunit 3